MRKTLNEAIDFGKVAEKAVAIMKGKGHSVVMFTLDGMETADPEEARRFYVKTPNYMVTIDEDNAQLRINKNSKVKLDELEAVMKQLRNLARQYMLKYELKVFGKEIAPKDFAFQAKKYRDKKMNQVSEAALSKMHGSTKTSYQTLESTKIIVRHRKPVQEEVRGARSRQINAIFIEQAGERFRFPHNNLAGARAMARHIDEGGEMHDAVGAYIIESVANLIKLSEFIRYTRTNKLINETSEDIIKIVRENMAAYRREISKFQGATTYAKMCEQIASREGSELEEDTDELKDMFTVRKFDEKIGDTLPLIKRLVTEKNAWRSMIEEASTEAFAVTSTEDLIEADVIEFDSPVQKLGYKIRALSERVIEESELSKFVHKIGNKLIEGNELSKFEKSVVGNVLENIEVAEQAEVEFVDKLEESFNAWSAKIDKLAEANFPAQGSEQECAWWAGCHNDATTTEPHPILGDVPICDRCVSKLRKIEGLDEAEGDTCSRCRKGTMERGETMTGPAERCNRCGWQHQVREDDDDGCETCRGWDPDDQSVCPDCFGQNAIDGSVTEDDWDDEVRRGESESGATGMGMPMDDNESNSEKIQDLLDRGIEVVSQVSGMVGKIIKIDDNLALIHHKASRRKGWASVNRDTLSLQPHKFKKGAYALVSSYDDKLSEEPGDWDHGYNYEGQGNIDPEDFMDECPACSGTGMSADPFGPGGGDCEKCDGNGYV